MIKKHFIAYSFIAISLFISSCQKNFISSESYHKTVINDLTTKLDSLDGVIDITNIYKLCANTKEKEAIEFLYAYMPLGDMIDYSPEFHVKTARLAFKAQKEMPWGKNIPEELFRHFVLPNRANNESMDNSREIFYNELKDRVKNLSMYDAILEVNHWCHEKVIYTPSDGRTSSPLASIKTAHGRCGEESVFAVAALRSVGIPARQVYTPRWAHTDDNHAWVEAWADGKWYYLGACEPEPKLNVAWFSSTAVRGILMHSKVFGKYEGNDEIISKTDIYTETNATSNYAPVEKINITIYDKDNKIVPGVPVEFKIYNYSEYYSAIITQSNNNGQASATIGKGDIMIWSSSNGYYGYKKVSVGKDDSNIKLVLDKKIGDVYEEDLDIIPPVQSKVAVTLSDEEKAANKVRLEKEDSIRNIYVSSFAKMDDAIKLAKETKFLVGKENKIYSYLIKSRGNWKEIYNFISSLNNDNYKIGLSLLDIINEKDLRDTPSAVLNEHLINYIKAVGEKANNEVYIKYVLNPRISNELITPWRSELSKVIKTNNLDTISTINKIITLSKSIKILNNYNPQRIKMSPIGVYKLNAADQASREIFFVALCRSYGIPARIEEISSKLQYYSNNRWIDVTLNKPSNKNSNLISEKGELRIKYTPNKNNDNPKFDTHFTIAKIDKGSIKTLNFRDDEGFEGTATWKSISKKPIILDEGYYMLTSGTRMASGKVLSHISFFNINKNKITTVKLIMREDNNDFQVLGSFNPEALMKKIQLKENESTYEIVEKTIMDCTGRGFFTLGFLKANHEPSNHAIRSVFEKEPIRPTILFYSNEDEYLKFTKTPFPDAPKGITFGLDIDNKILESIIKEMKIKNLEMPLFIIADTFDRIVYISEGYNIGTAEQLNRTL